MICWYEAGVTDSFRPTRRRSWSSRCRPVYQQLVRDGFPPGIALDDGVGAHYAGTELVEVISPNGSSRGYRVDAAGETPLTAVVV
jgi:hypothetical protein